MGDLTLSMKMKRLSLLINLPDKVRFLRATIQSGTIANVVAGKFAQERLPATVHVVTRLDKDTSGLICIAKNRHIHHLLSEQMTNSGFHRQYVAMVEGHVEKDKFSIDATNWQKRWQHY